jgi:hypothetical protein
MEDFDMDAIPDLTGGGGFDMNDDYGMNLLANTKYMKPGGGGGETTFNVAPGGGGGGSGLGGIEEIEIGKMDAMDAINVDFNAAPNTPNISIQKETSYYNGAQNSGFSTVQLSSGMSPEQERREKNHYITQLQRLEKKGYPITKQFTIDMPLQEMKEEYERLTDAKKMEGSIQWQREAVVFAVNTLEMLNGNFPFLGLKLKGWKDSVQDKVESEQFDDIFEELYEKYKGKSYMPPEIRLLFGIASSGVLCHYSNKMLESIQTPSVESVLRSNPELARQVAAASMQQSMPGMANFIQANGGSGGGNGFGSANQGSMRTGSAPAQMQENPMMSQGGGTGAFFGTGRTADVPQNVASQPAQQTARKEMRGPAGVDDILKTFESVRRAESTERPPTPQMPMQQIPMSAAMAAAIDMQSVTSDDFRSVMSDQTAGGTIRRKRRAPPVGNSINLNV